MARKERTDYKTQEVTYEELYCDECSRLVDDLYPVSFAGLGEEEWCEDCIGERVSRFSKARIKTEELLEWTDEQVMRGKSPQQLFCVYLIISAIIGGWIGYAMGEGAISMVLLAALGPMYGIIGIFVGGLVALAILLIGIVLYEYTMKIVS